MHMWSILTLSDTSFCLQIDPNWEDDDGVELASSVDGIHCPIAEPRPFNKKHKSHKFGSAGLVCECCLLAHKPKMAWLNGPCPAGTQDKTVFRKQLMKKIKDKQLARQNDFRAIADDGHFAKAFLDVLAFRNEFDDEEIAWHKDRALSRHEKFNGLTRRFDALNVKFGHDKGWNTNMQHPRHKACVEAICVTVQCELDLGLVSLFDPCPQNHFRSLTFLRAMLLV